MSPAANEGFAVALTRARVARDRAYGLRAPTSSDLEDLRAREGAIDRALGAWAKARVAAAVESDKAYQEALRDASEPGEEVIVRAELAELWFSVVDAAEAAVIAAAPATVRFNPAFVASTRIAAAKEFAAVRVRVAFNLDHCIRLAGERSGPGTYLQRCQDIALRLTEPAGLEAQDRGDAGSAVAAASAAREALSETHRILPTTRPKPCAFRGTVAVSGKVWSAPAGGTVVAELAAQVPVDVDELELPSAMGARYKVALAGAGGPRGWLDAPEAPLVLKRKVDLVPDHLWAPRGLRVDAAEPRGPTVRVVPVGTRGPHRAAENDPTTLDRRIFCFDLELVTPSSPTLESNLEEGGEKVSLKGEGGSIALFASPPPLGKLVARVPVSGTARVIERRGGFVRVRLLGPLLYDGWVRTAQVQVAAPADLR